MSGGVIQGTFLAGGPKLATPAAPPPAHVAQARMAQPVAQPSAMPRPPGPPMPAHVAQPRMAQAQGGAIPRQPGPPAPAHVVQPRAPQAQPRSVQPQAAGGAIAVDPALLRAAARPGQPLPDAVQRKMEQAFGADFSSVRVHEGPQAESIGAIAFTVGTDIYFAPGRFQPQTAAGQQLLGHELTHVLQQRAGRVRNPLGSSLAVVQDHALEAEADRMGHRAAAQMMSAQTRMAPHLGQSSLPVRISAPVSSGPSSYRLTAAIGGRRVGSVMVHTAEKASVEVTDLGVDPAHRQHGIGRMLLASAARTGQRLGKSKVGLAAQDDGSGRLTQWYTDMGFSRVGLNQLGKPRLEVPVCRLVGGSVQQKGLLKGSSTVQAMEERSGRPKRRPELREQFQNVQILKLELPGSSYYEWITRNGKSTSGQILSGNQLDLQPYGVTNGQMCWHRQGQDGTDIITIAGPTGIESCSGARDAGPNSIENNVKLARLLIFQSYSQWFANHTEEPNSKFLVIIKAHSRNAVAGTHIANYVKTTLAHEDAIKLAKTSGYAGHHEQELPKCRVLCEAVFFDPVPGPGHYAEDVDKFLNCDDSTVIYSVDPGKRPINNWFDPQLIRNAKRVIISRRDHTLGMDNGFIYNRRTYKGSAITCLEHGIYVNLVGDIIEKCEDFETAMSMIEELPWATEARKCVVKRALSNRWSVPGPVSSIESPPPSVASMGMRRRQPETDANQPYQPPLREALEQAGHTSPPNKHKYE